MATIQTDHYATLGVPRTASQKEIRAAFRKLARTHHPDVNGGDPAAEARFKAINQAHEVLGDPEKRGRYDTHGDRWEEIDAWEKAGRPGAPPGAAPFGTGPFGAGGPGPQVEYREMSADDLEELLGGGAGYGDLFGGMFRGGGFGSAGPATPRPRRGADLQADTAITLEEAFSGTTRTVEIGTGAASRRVEVRIPAGIADGALVRAAGQGGPGVNGGAAGDVHIRVRLLPHPTLRRDGATVHVRAQVPLDVALLGGEVEVPTPKGTRALLRVPEGTQNGARLRLRGLGMPRLRGAGNGDLIAEVDVRLPVPLPPEARVLAEALRTGGELAAAA